MAVDPSLKEEAAMEGCVTVVMNPHGEVCLVQKSIGIGVTYSQLSRCMTIAQVRALGAIGLQAAGIPSVSRYAETHTSSALHD